MVSDMEELDRVEDVLLDAYAYETTCLGCGEGIVLRYNGGELDRKVCCGREYVLEAPRIDFVTYAD